MDEGKPEAEKAWVPQVQSGGVWIGGSEPVAEDDPREVERMLRQLDEQIEHLGQTADEIRNRLGIAGVLSAERDLAPIKEMQEIQVTNMGARIDSLRMRAAGITGHLVDTLDRLEL